MDIADISEDEYVTDSDFTEKGEVEPCGCGQSDTEDELYDEDDVREAQADTSENDGEGGIGIDGDRSSDTEETMEYEALEGKSIRRLVACRECSGSMGRKGLIRCLRRAKTVRHRGPRLKHLPTVQRTPLAHCLAVLIPDQEIVPDLEEEGIISSTDQAHDVLRWNDSNLDLRFVVPCGRCLTLGACRRLGHSAKVVRLADLAGLDDSKRPIVAQAPLAKQEDYSQTRRLRPVKLDEGNFELPRSINANRYKDVVCIDINLWGFSITSERRPDMDGDFDIDDTLTRGHAQITSIKGICMANIIKLRVLRDTLLWDRGPGSKVHRVVAARVFRLWENKHPQNSRRLTELLERQGDKSIRIHAPNGGPSGEFHASDLRDGYLRRHEEIGEVMNALDEAEIREAPPLNPAPSPPRALAAQRGAEEGNAAPRDRVAKRMSSGGEEFRAAEVAPVEGSGQGETCIERVPVGRDAGASGVPSRRASRGHQGMSGRIPRAMKAVDGKLYLLPTCIICSRGRLLMQVTLKTFLVNGQRLFQADGVLNRGGLQKKFYCVQEFTRENLLALRAVRDTVYVSNSVHPLVASMAFEIWESEHKGTYYRDNETIVITGSKRDQDRPTLKLTAGELRGLRGVTRMHAIQDMFNHLRSSPEVMAGVLQEADPSKPHEYTTCGNEPESRSREHEQEPVEGESNAPDLCNMSRENGTRDDAAGAETSDDDEVALTHHPVVEVPGEKRKMRDVEPRSRSGSSGKRTAVDNGGRADRYARRTSLVAAPKATTSVPSAPSEPPEEPEKLTSEAAAAARKTKWLEAVKENDESLKVALERIRKEEELVKEAHMRRTKDLMQWMVDEQSGKHDDKGSEGPPAIEHGGGGGGGGA